MKLLTWKRDVGSASMWVCGTGVPGRWFTDLFQFPLFLYTASISVQWMTSKRFRGDLQDHQSVYSDLCWTLLYPSSKSSGIPFWNSLAQHSHWFKHRGGELYLQPHQGFSRNDISRGGIWFTPFSTSSHIFHPCLQSIYFYFLTYDFKFLYSSVSLPVNWWWPFYILK